MEREEGKAATAELFAQSAAQAAAKEEALAAEAAESKAAESEAAELLPGQSSVDLALADPATDVPTMYEPVLELVKLATGATHAYLGVKGTAEPESEGDPAKPVISWLAGTSGSSMAGEALVGANPDDEESKAEGVTFDLFVGAEPPEPAEGDEPLPEGADPLIYPSEVMPVLYFLECIRRETSEGGCFSPSLVMFLPLGGDNVIVTANSDAYIFLVLGGGA